MTLYLGIDIGGTKIAGGLVTSQGRVVSHARQPTPLTGGVAILEAALGLAESLRAKSPEPVTGIGIGTGGQVDPERGVIVSATDILPGWAGTAVKTAFEEVFGLPTFVDNDVNALAAGEGRFGAGRGLATVLYLALGTGVGGALLLGGRLHHGAHWSGAEFGHLLLTTDEGAPRKTLEDWASGPGLTRTYQEMSGQTQGITGEMIAAEAMRDPAGLAAQSITRTGECLGFGLAGLANALDPDLIVIGGGLAALGDMLLAPARRILRQYGLPGPAQCSVVLASLGADAALVGAASLAMTAAPPSLASAGTVNRPLTIALVPLDERPVNTRYPQMLGEIGGATVLLPPPEIRGLQRVPADKDGIAAWLLETARQADAAIVSGDFLGCGNLINARISHDSATDILARLQLLADINPACPVHAFSIITRVSNADDAVEEPDYWAQWGTKFYRYARLTHQAEVDAPHDADELARLEQTLPQDLKMDWLTRRLRNHTVNLGLLDLAARGRITSLRLTSDDTSPYGFPSRERDWLRGWTRLLGSALTDRVLMHPGADEVGSALLSKLLMDRRGKSPRVGIVYSHPEDAALVAPYEDRPVLETVEGQIAACGCRLAEDIRSCDFVLGVATPSPRRTDYRSEYLAEDRVSRMEVYDAFLSDLGNWQSQGVPVALADVAYPNGSDPLLTERLLSADSPLAPARLAAYGAWNTAGNTLGVVAAQAACAGLVGEDMGRIRAQQIFLAHRFLEDWGYQTVTRREARAEAERLWGRREPDPSNPDEQSVLCAFIEGRLRERLGELQTRGIGAGLELMPCSMRLPWRRTFEVDFAFA